jgi:hypothetical protein
MFASQLLRRSYNHYMLSTPSFKGLACAGFEHWQAYPSPSSLRGGQAPAFYVLGTPALRPVLAYLWYAAGFLASGVPRCLPSPMLRTATVLAARSCGLSPSADGGCASPLFTGIVTIQNIFNFFSMIFRRFFVVDFARKSAREIVSSELLFFNLVVTSLT